MKKHCLFILSIAFLFCGVSYAQSKSSVRHISAKTPVGFESEINDFLRQDSLYFPPSGLYLFTGSSTIRKWDSLQNDFSGITLIQRGFGGSTMKALNYYTDRIVLPYKPATIVVYEGDNDLAQGMAPGEFISLCDTFIRKVRAVLPKTMIYFMSVKPSFARKQLLPVQDETNRQLKKLTKKRKRTEFMDIRQLMYDPEGKLRRDFFEPDSLHVNRACYRVWAGYMKTKLDNPFNTN
jgi:hypothetical protein